MNDRDDGGLVQMIAVVEVTYSMDIKELQLIQLAYGFDMKCKSDREIINEAQVSDLNYNRAVAPFNSTSPSSFTEIFAQSNILSTKQQVL